MSVEHILDEFYGLIDAARLYIRGGCIHLERLGELVDRAGTVASMLPEDQARAALMDCEELVKDLQHLPAGVIVLYARLAGFSGNRFPAMTRYFRRRLELAGRTVHMGMAA